MWNYIRRDLRINFFRKIFQGSKALVRLDSWYTGRGGQIACESQSKTQFTLKKTCVKASVRGETWFGSVWRVEAGKSWKVFEHFDQLWTVYECLKHPKRVKSNPELCDDLKRTLRRSNEASCEGHGCAAKFVLASKVDIFVRTFWCSNFVGWLKSDNLHQNLALAHNNNHKPTCPWPVNLWNHDSSIVQSKVHKISCFFTQTRTNFNFPVSNDESM